MYDMSEEFTINEAENGQRLDVWCVSKLPQLSRTALQKAIKAGYIRINSEVVKPRQAIRTNDAITVQLPTTTAEAAPQETMEIPIIFEDPDVVVINKPPGVIAHTGVGTSNNTVSDWFVTTYPESAQVGESSTERAGIVHRLDKDTSGVMILAKNQQAYDHLKERFQKRRVKKEYLALVFNSPTDAQGRIVQAMNRSKRNPMRRTIDPEGKQAITEWTKEQVFDDLRDRRVYALLRVRPLTGRMHQIRVHLHHLGFPIVGDALYTFKRQSPPQGVARQLLHAQKLSLELPTGEHKTFTAPLPDDFANVLEPMQKHEL